MTDFGIDAPTLPAMKRNELYLIRLNPEKLNRFALVCLLVGFFLEAYGSLQHKSPTFDEVLYIPAGYSFLQTGSVMTNPETHPLPRALTALGLIFMNLNFDPQDIPPFKARFQWSSDFLFNRNAPQAEKIVFRGRLPSIFLSLVLLVILAWWSRSLYGPAASIVTLAFASLEPNLIAHSSLATPDLPLTAFFFFTVFGFWYWLEHQQSRAALILTGTLMGATLLCKSTGLFLAPILLLIWFGDVLFRSAADRPAAWKTISRVFLIYVIAFTFVNLVFLFQGTLSDKQEIIRLTLGNRIPTLLRWFVFFLPDHYAFPLLFNAAQSLGEFHPFPFFLNGHLSKDGFWYYFFEAVFIKTPLPLLIWIGISGSLTLRFASPRVCLTLFVPSLFLLMYFSFFNKLDLGLRYILPAYPFLLMIAGAPFGLPVKISRKWLSSVAALLLLWNVWNMFQIYPFHLAFFNELVGGPRNGYRFLVDSNLDWGQDLGNLKRYMEERRIDRVSLSYFGTADPRHYGIRYDYLPSPEFQPWTIRHRGDAPFQPAPGVYAISATNLQGLYLQNPDTFAVFRNRSPEAWVGYSILIYSYP